MFPPTPDEPATPMTAIPPLSPADEVRTNALSGPFGLRAGWGLLLFVVLSVMLFFVLFAGLFKVTGQMRAYQESARSAQAASARARATHQPQPAQNVGLATTLLLEAAEAGAVLLAAWAVGLLEKRRFGVYGLPLRYGRDALPGAVCGLVAISLLVGLLRALHLLVFDQRLLQGPAILRLGSAWIVTFFFVGLFEEFLFRGYIQFTLMRGLLGLGTRLAPGQPQRFAFWAAALLWSLLFCVTHLTNAGEDPFGLVMVFLAGILFSYALWRTGSLWWGIGFHMTWDWGQSFLFGVPDSGTLSAGRLFATHAVGQPLLSGGGTGPEGSIYVVPVLLLVAVVVRLHPQRAQPPLAPESLPLVPPAAQPQRIP